jgi:uncharacterized protein (TIGR03435 family)
MIPVIFLLSALQTFDVASIHAVKTDAPEGGRDKIEYAPGTLTMRNVTLSTCMQWAHHVQPFQITGPSWISSERYDIVARAEAAPEAQLRLMLQALLADRFKLAFHRDKKELPVLVMLVGKNGHKLHVSTEEGEGFLNTGKGAAVTAKHVSMSQYAGLLSGPLRMPVLDMTGLEGRYDFSVDLAPYMARDADGRPPDVLEAIQTAFQDQLGLKLEPRKSQVEIIVIDRAEKAPTAN